MLCCNRTEKHYNQRTIVCRTAIRRSEAISYYCSATERAATLQYFFLYILCSMCLFWEFHNKMTVIYHYKALYHLVNKRALSLSLLAFRGGLRVRYLY